MARPAKILLKEDLLRAMERTRSNRAAARYLHVSYNHYKKYAKLYVDTDTGTTLLEVHKNQAGKGIPKFLTGEKGEGKKEPALMDILEGRVPIYHFTPERIKTRIIAEGLIDESCSICKFNERRVLDYKVPLILHFKDGNKENYMLKNMDFLCYNCYFLFVADIFSGKEITALEDYHDGQHVEEPNWELDDYMKDHLKELGLIKESPYISGSEFLSYQ